MEGEPQAADRKVHAQRLDLGGRHLLSLLQLGPLLFGRGIVDVEIYSWRLGNLAGLQNLQVNETQLSGPLPKALTKLPLTLFHFDGTNLCEPGDTTFQAWLSAIPNLQRTGAVCGSSLIWLPVIFSQF